MPNDEDEHRQEDRLRDREHDEQHRLEHFAEVVVLGDQHAQRRAQRHRDDEGEQHFGGRDAERLAHLGALQQLAQHAEHVAQRRQQQRVDDAVARQQLPGRQHQRQQRRAREQIFTTRSSLRRRYRLEVADVDVVHRREAGHADQPGHVQRALHPFLPEFAVGRELDDVAVELGGRDRLRNLVDLGDQLDRRGAVLRRAQEGDAAVQRVERLLQRLRRARR